MSQPTRNAPAGTTQGTRGGFGQWLRLHQLSAAFVGGLLLIAAAVAAGVSIRQDVATTSTAVAPEVKFVAGTDYTTINAAGFATLTIASNGASATLSVQGVAGAAAVDLTKILKIQNTAASAYTLTLSTSASLPAGLSSFLVTIKTTGGGAVTNGIWDAAAGGSSSAITLPASTTYDISLELVETAAASGTLGTFNLQFTLTPA
ncbi:MAG: hypothetical protein V4510_11155 [bacterium]